jgi:tetratricopeptide (TPR) repeat protein
MRKIFGKDKLIWGMFLCCLFMGLSGQVGAHEDIHKKAEPLTEKIEADPNNAVLYFKRGEIYRSYMEWDHALADYEKACRLDPLLLEAELSRAQVFLSIGFFHTAEFVLNQFIQAHPDSQFIAPAFVARGRTRVKLGKFPQAASDYSHAIERIEHPKPEYFLERARAYAAGGEQYIDKALEGLDQAMGKWPQIDALQSYAVELELGRENYETAIKRLERLAQTSTTRKEKWMAQRAKLLEQTDKIDQAIEVYQETLDTINQLSSSRRKAKPTLELKELCQKHLEALKQKRNSKK